MEAAFALVAGIPSIAGDGSTALPRGNGHPVLLPARAAGGLGGLLDEMLAATAEIDGFSQQRLLRSAILHLIAAALAHGIDGDSGAAGYAETVKKRISDLDPQPGGSQLETLNRLADPRHLRGLLS